ncbi:hypothetical protein QJS10_CPB04g00438 [Acorus calamus]|uniref:Uncharacterized protein n=1 Tax=Acorus calamus TaxID=4465 RepID=A0AAV9F324_ACOCL|nr:hypothetical protein QJS10_CPB04g00438 [Acorus calamus]
MMLRLLYKKFFPVSPFGDFPSSSRFFHENASLKSITHSSESSSLTVSYLTSSCGLSPKAALRTSKWFTLKTTKNADLVLDFLRNQGFEQTLIAKALTVQPGLLELHPERNLRPKMDFLIKYGFSDSQLSRILSRDPSIFTCSLDKTIAPAFEFLKGLVGTRENVISVIDHSAHPLRQCYKKRLMPNISILREHGVPVSRVSRLIIKYPRSLCMASPTRFREAVVAVHGMGIRPCLTIFVEAVRAMVSISKSIWDGKVEVYKSLGWSEDEIVSAFSRFPMCMMYSEKKIRSGMEYYIKVLGWDPSYVSSHPVLLCYSLEKRVIPRCSVLQVLLAKDLIKEDLKWTTALYINEEQFLERFVTKYMEEAPELMRVYHGMTGSKGIAAI